MKKHIISSVLCITITFLFQSCNKYEVSEVQAESFVKFFGSSGEDMAADLIQTDDGGYGIVGTIQTTEKGSEIYIIRTDRYGNEIWPAKTYGGNLDDIGYDIERDTDGGMVFLGSISDTTSEGDLNRNAILVKLDQNGNEIWTKTIGSENDEEAVDLLINSTGEYLIVGYQNSNSSKNYWYVILGTDREILYQDAFGYMSQNEEIINIKEMNSGEYIALGNRTTTSGTDISAIVIDVNGVYTSEVLYQRTGTDISGSSVSSGTELIQVATGNNNTLSQTVILLLKLTISKSQAVIDPFKEIEISGANLAGTSICQLSEGGWGIIGTKEIAGNEDIYLLKTDTQGDEIFSTLFGGTGSQKGVAIQQTPDGGFIILGSSTFDRNSMITLIKTKPDGSL